jgi:diadenosine tetraphosphate (Ap4A) HIT family hydrolase
LHSLQELFICLNKMEDCIFCKIAKGEIPCHKIWEDKKHVAFLTPFPNTEGAAVVATKEHYDSYAFDLPEEVLKELVIASKNVAKLIDKNIKDVGRTGLIFEGFGVNHVHSKLYPMHGTADMKEWKPIETKEDTFFEKYPGHLTSVEPHNKTSDEELEKVAKKIKGE